jgi:ABC-type multidrug transport system fused ATPase/permease subunit
VFKLLVDEVFYNKNLKNFFIIILGYLILYVTEQLFHLILNVLWPYQFTVFLTDVRKAIYMKIMSMPYKYFSNTPVGEMMTTINHDSEGFVELIHRNIEYLLANILRIIINGSHCSYNELEISGADGSGCSFFLPSILSNRQKNRSKAENSASRIWWPYRVDV